MTSPFSPLVPSITGVCIEEAKGAHGGMIMRSCLQQQLRSSEVKSHIRGEGGEGGGICPPKKRISGPHCRRDQLWALQAQGSGHKIGMSVGPWVP